MERRRSGRRAAVVYGRNPVLEALKGRRRVHRIWTAEGNEALVREVRAAVDPRRYRDLEIRPVAREILEELAEADSHQGVAAEVDPYIYADPAEILATEDLVVVLDRIQDPHNLGAIVRTADAAGAAVVIPRHRAAEITPAVVSASAGATEHVPVARVRNLTDFVGRAKEAGFWIYGTMAQAERPYDREVYPAKVVFCLGSEGEGLGRRLAESCDLLVSIPLAGRVGSLNVSVAAGIVLFEVRRQRSEGG